MRLKVAQGLALTQKQLREVAELVMTEPDMGWDYDETSRSKKTGVYNVSLSGEFGTYEYRVNTSFNLITLKAVK